MKVKVCMGSNCTLLGAMDLLDQIEDLKKLTSEDDNYSDDFDIEVVKCLGFCKKSKDNVAPVVVIDDEILFNATGQIVMEKIMSKKKK
ncbi:MAG: (2Fe-2S) ferredoxin domain-containing protein [Tissierellia bacterium]|nr:(2Fe-2S) ferredoxin domain-containing protein [Tissierellia bacterium]